MIKRESRYTITGLLMVTTIVALTISYIKSTLQLHVTTIELVAARSELRELEIRDPEKISVVSLPTSESLHWRWRMHLPRGNGFVLRSAFADIPVTGLPSNSEKHSHVFYDGYGVPLDSAEPFVFSIHLDKNKGGEWVLKTRNPARGMTKGVSMPPDWLTCNTGAKTDLDFLDWTQVIAGQQSMTSATATDPFVLTRYRNCRREGLANKREDREPVDGIMFWIEQVPSR